MRTLEFAEWMVIFDVKPLAGSKVYALLDKGIKVIHVVHNTPDADAMIQFLRAKVDSGAELEDYEFVAINDAMVCPL